MKKLNAALLLLILSAGCSKDEMDFSKFEKESKGNFLSVMGYALIVPGVEDYQNTYKGKIEVFIIPGTSDAIESKQHKRYNDAAYEYALRHNQLLLTAICQNQSDAAEP